MAKLYLFNKPFQVLSQFTDSEGRDTLAKYLPIKDAYPAGRLDYDSEGLLLLTDEGQLQHQISHPKHKLPKTYWVQVEGIPSREAIKSLCQGVTLNDGPTLPAKAKLIDEPDSLWPRTPPIRQRDSIPTQWLQITISEGRNRQVRRMTAAVGHPTLRLIRASIGNWQLADLQPGDFRQETIHLAAPTKQKPRGTHNKRSSQPRHKRQKSRT
ncbi:pseudouridine synthase [Maricurvus nonylphenolicus]|uniref:pseudouridine synthase n=1 Tax=Maricurvus nonylphenolicus TaxID=1008307 RepID=UPI0036F3CA40